MRTVITEKGKLAVEFSSQELQDIKKLFEDLHPQLRKAIHQLLTEIIEEDKKKNKEK